jgi:hypothetical protein
MVYLKSILFILITFYSLKKKATEVFTQLVINWIAIIIPSYLAISARESPIKNNI